MVQLNVCKEFAKFGLPRLVIHLRHPRVLASEVEILEPCEENLFDQAMVIKTTNMAVKVELDLRARGQLAQISQKSFRNN